MIGVQFTIKGDKALIRRLEAFPVRVQRNIGRKAIRPAASIVNKAAKKSVPAFTDAEAKDIEHDANATGTELRRFIKRSIGRVRRTYRGSGIPIEAVGPRYNFFRPGHGASGGWTAQRAEFGTDRTEAKPFMSGVVSDVGEKAVGVMLDRARELVEEEARRG